MLFDIPAGLPVLGGGAHDDPTRGACFMEYVSLLAGEPWSDNPMCVEDGLALIMQNINDRATDQTRHLLVPLLGRSIGLAPAPWPQGPSQWERVELPQQEVQRLVDLSLVGRQRYAKESLELRKCAWNHFGPKIGLSYVNQDFAEDDPSGYFMGQADMGQADQAFVGEHDGDNPEYIAHLVDWATKLHESYEEAMKELGYERSVYTQTCSVPTVAAWLTYPELFYVGV